MSRVNWMSIATWTVLVVCIVLAFGFGYTQWDRLANTRLDKEKVDQQVAVQDKAQQILENSPRPPTGILTAPDNGREEVEFLSQLQRLMLTAGVRQVQLDRAGLNSLPPIAGTAVKPGEKKANAAPEPSLVNLPLGVHAVTSNLAVVGPFANIHAFLHLVRNYRYQVRAININSMTLAPADDKGNLRAGLALTRFIRPNEPTLTPLLSEGTTGTETGRSPNRLLIPSRPQPGTAASSALTAPRPAGSTP